MNNSLKRLLSIILSTVMVLSSCVFVNTAVVMASDSYITEEGGWLESAYVEWSSVPDATGFAAYVKGADEADSAYVQLDNELIRKYPTYFRADAVGLAAGQYVIKVVPYINDVLDESAAFVSDVLDVKANDRSGFAFSSNSKYGTASGAYNDDGTLKSDAKVFYVTSDTAATITADVVTSSKGAVTTYTGMQNIITAKQKGYDTTPFDFRIIGTIEAEDMDGFDSSAEGLQVKGKNSYSEMNITIEGIGEDAAIRNFGILLRNCGNVELRNFAIYLCMDDCISMDTDNCNIWVHNIDLYYGQTGSDSDQAKGDGTVDIKADSQYVTVSYNHLWDSGKASLCGMSSESGPNYITYHHNWFDHSDSRHPRIRTMSVHVYNNYFDGNSKYGVGVTTGGSAFVESNVFESCKYPMMISKQGTDATGDGTFSGEDGGVIKAYNNTISGASSYITQNTSSTSFDAVEVTSRDAEVSSSYTALVGGTTYDNSGLAVSNVNATPEDVSTVKSTVTTYAGRMNGGDFFEATGTSRSDYTGLTDATSYDVDTTLKAAITNYQPTLVSVGGTTTGGTVQTTVSTTTTTTEATTETTTEEVTETTTVSTPVAIGEAETGFLSDDASDTGSGVSVVYNAATDSWKLTDTSSTAAAEITIPFEEQTSGKVVISGTVEPSTTASKWMFVQIKGTKADGTSGEIIAFGGGSDKTELSVRVNGASTYNKVTTLSAKSYDYTIIFDLDNKTAEVTIDGVTNTYSVDVASISSVYSTTSKSGSRNVTLSVPYVGVLTDEAETTTNTVTESTTEATTNTVTESTTETATDEPVDTKVYGDVNSSKTLEIEDAAMLIDMILNSSAEYIDGITDVTCDGKVDTADVATILQKILNSTWLMPCEEQESGGSGDSDVTEATTDAATEATTAAAETTTDAETETTTEAEDSGSYYNFEESPEVTLDGTSGIVYTVSTSSSAAASDGLTAEASIVTYNGSKVLYLNDVSTTDTVKVTLPLEEKSSGTVIYTATITPSVASTNWTLMQLNGVKADDTEGEVLGVRTDSSKAYGLRVNAGSTVTSAGVVSAENTAAVITIVVDFDNDTASISVDGGTAVTVTGVDAKSITSMSFQTATGARSLYVDNAGITTNSEASTETTTEGSETTTESSGSETGASSYVQNFTADGTSSTFYTISGNLSTDKGTVTYNGLTLTQCLKMETATSITFTAPSAGTLTMVFNASDSKCNCKIDGTKYTADSSGILTVDLEAGSHTITKADSSNLFYMVFTTN